MPVLPLYAFIAHTGTMIPFSVFQVSLLGRCIFNSWLKLQCYKTAGHSMAYVIQKVTLTLLKTNLTIT